MRREIVSALIGAGVVCLIWAGSSLCSRGAAPAPAPESPEGLPAVTDFPGRLKQPVNHVYSAGREEGFPGLRLYNTDFLVPLNRLTVTGHAVFDDPAGDYGSGGMPMYAFLFRIEDKGGDSYFLTAGQQWRPVSELVYLGKDIAIEKVAPAGNGFLLAVYKDKQGRTGKGFVSISTIPGSDPVPDPGIARRIDLDPLMKYAEKCDPFVYKINAEQFWELYRKAIRENDRNTIARMVDLPCEVNGERIYTRAEFLERFDEILPEKARKEILRYDKSARIMYSWRGAMLPDGSWLRNAAGKNDPAGPLSL